MKKILFFLTTAFMLVSASTTDKINSDRGKSIEGTWELVSFFNYDDGVNISDTIFKDAGYRQVKMYYNNKVMWSRYVPNEATGRFGYGNYYTTDDELHETIVYGDAQMMKALDTLTEFAFELHLKKNTFSQISVDEEGNRTFSENYVRID